MRPSIFAKLLLGSSALALAACGLGAGAGGSAGTAAGGPGSAGNGSPSGSGAGGSGAGPHDSDPHNCGRGLHDCCGGACVGGICQPLVLAHDVAGVQGALAVDASHIHWAKATPGSQIDGIYSMPKAGGKVTELAAAPTPAGVAVDATHAYWVTGPASGGVFKVLLDGGAVVPLVPTGEVGAQAILVHGSDVLWAATGSGEIRKVGIDGSSLTTLATSSLEMNAPASQSQIATAGSWVYWPGIQRVAIDGTGATVLGQVPNSTEIAVDVGYAYTTVTSPESIFDPSMSVDTILRVPLGGGAATPVANGAGVVIYGVIAVDYADPGTPPPGPERYVYWSNNLQDDSGMSSVRATRVTGAGGPGIELAHSSSPGNLSIDATCVYWADSYDGTISVVAKP